MEKPKYETFHYNGKKIVFTKNPGGINYPSCTFYIDGVSEMKKENGDTELVFESMDDRDEELRILSQALKKIEKEIKEEKEERKKEKTTKTNWRKKEKQKKEDKQKEKKEDGRRK